MRCGQAVCIGSVLNQQPRREHFQCTQQGQQVRLSDAVSAACGRAFCLPKADSRTQARYPMRWLTWTGSASRRSGQSTSQGPSRRASGRRLLQCCSRTWPCSIRPGLSTSATSTRPYDGQHTSGRWATQSSHQIHVRLCVYCVIPWLPCIWATHARAKQGMCRLLCCKFHTAKLSSRQQRVGSIWLHHVAED